MVDAAHESPAHVWALAGTYPITPDAPRLVHVRNADKLRDWSPLADWFTFCRRVPTTHLLFESRLPDPPSTQDGPVAVLRDKRQGHLVRCSTPNPADLIAWVRRRSQLDADMAVRLLDRVNWNVSAGADACAKLALFPGSHGPKAIDAVAISEAGDFVDALLAGDKPAALAAGPATTTTFTVLASRVDLLAALWRAARAGKTLREIHGVPPHLAARYLTLAGKYDPKRCAHARRVLAVTEDAYRGGARTGVTEALVALW